MSCCDKYDELISLAIDGELDEAAMSEIKAHLDDCPDCRREYLCLSLVSQTLSGHRVNPPQQLSRDVMSRIESLKNPEIKTPRKKPRRFVLRYAALAACFALIIYAGAHYAPFMPSKSGETSQIVADDMKEAAVPLPEADIIKPSPEPFVSQTENDDYASNEAGGGSEYVHSNLPPAPLPETSAAPLPDPEMFLLSVSGASILGPSEPENEAVRLSEARLDELMALLGLSPEETHPSIDLDAELPYVLTFFDGDVVIRSLRLYIVSEDIFAFDGDGSLYAAACSPEAFLSYLGEE